MSKGKINVKKKKNTTRKRFFLGMGFSAARNSGSFTLAFA
jgi:hypothetical protein